MATSMKNRMERTHKQNEGQQIDENCKEQVIYWQEIDQGRDDATI